jgi:hypothetical protein
MQRGDRVRQRATGWTGLVETVIPMFDDAGRPTGVELLVRWDRAPNALACVQEALVDHVPHDS